MKVQRDAGAGSQWMENGARVNSQQPNTAQALEKLKRERRKILPKGLKKGL
jgi:hypothetical protein